MVVRVALVVPEDGFGERAGRRDELDGLAVELFFPADAGAARAAATFA
jgi:hypothetical protein